MFRQGKEVVTGSGGSGIQKAGLGLLALGAAGVGALTLLPSPAASEAPSVSRVFLDAGACQNLQELGHNQKTVGIVLVRSAIEETGDPNAIELTVRLHSLKEVEELPVFVADVTVDENGTAIGCAAYPADSVDINSKSGTGTITTIASVPVQGYVQVFFGSINNPIAPATGLISL